MHIDARPDRWLVAAAFPLCPLLILLLPGLALGGDDFANAEEQLTAFAGGRVPYWGFAVQAMGAVFLLPAALGVLALVRRRRRGVVLAAVGAGLAVVGAVALLVLLGMEFAQGFVLENATDRAAAVDLGLRLNAWPVFGLALGIGLGGAFLGLPLLTLALARSGVVPWAVPALFLLPLAVGFVPLPPAAANIVPMLLILVPCVWVGTRLPGASLAAVDRGGSVSSDSARGQVLA